LECHGQIMHHTSANCNKMDFLFFMLHSKEKIFGLK
jgi:hypothetical protein